jgi:hypothetical protein
VEVDHTQRRIVIRSWFFAARREPSARRQLKAILGFWQKQNGKFYYRLKTAQGSVNYRIVFDLREAPGVYSEAGFFLPDPSVPLSMLNQVEVVSSQQLERLGELSPGRRVVGYAPNNFIYIASDVADETWIGIHEAGHRLGVGHHSMSVMTPEFTPSQSRLPKQAIREMLATANIIGGGMRARSLARYPVQAAEVVHHGTLPQGFYTQGKVKRR